MLLLLLCELATGADDPREAEGDVFCTDDGDLCAGASDLLPADCDLCADDCDLVAAGADLSTVDCALCAHGCADCDLPEAACPDDSVDDELLFADAGVLFTSDDEDLRAVASLWLAAAPEAVPAAADERPELAVADELLLSPFAASAARAELPLAVAWRAELLRVPCVLAYKASPSLLDSGRE